MANPIIQTTSKQAGPQPLRRATYVHISDLISAYNIDHALLEKEIIRVNTDRARTSTDDKTSNPYRTEHGRLLATKQDVDATGYNSDSSDGVPAPDEGLEQDTSMEVDVREKRLQPPRRGFNLCALVGSLNLVVDKRRVDQSRVRLAEVEIGDETGTVSLRARDEQIDLLDRVRNKGIRSAVVLRNCTLELYQGKHIRLAVTKWGKLTEYPDNVSSTPPPPSSMNRDRNFSLIDLSLVATEISDKAESNLLPDTNESGSSKESKKTDVESRTSGSTTSPKTAASSSKKGKSNTKHHSQNSRRNSRSQTGEQRRQIRSPHHKGRNVETGHLENSNQVMFHGMHGYHSYGDQRTDMDIQQQQQYSPHMQYSHQHVHPQSNRRQDAASMQYSLHQQYEMQQRQLHQLYNREQIRQHPQHHHASPMLVRPDVSFDLPGGSELGNSPILMPPIDHYAQSQGMGGHSTGLHPNDSRRLAPRGTATSYPSMSGMPFYQTREMNPDATSFAPSYLSPTETTSHQQQVHGTPMFSHYNISQQQRPFPATSIYPSIQHSYYGHPGMGTQYHSAVPQGSFDTSLDQTQDSVGGGATVGEPATTTTGQKSQNDPSSSSNSNKVPPSTTDKENMTK